MLPPTLCLYEIMPSLPTTEHCFSRFSSAEVYNTAFHVPCSADHDTVLIPTFVVSWPKLPTWRIAFISKIHLIQLGGNPLQNSCLENPVDRGAWWAVAQSWTWLKWLSMHACIGEGNGNPLQCSCLENPRDGGAWWAANYVVTQSRTRLKRLSRSSSSRIPLAHFIALFTNILCLCSFWNLAFGWTSVDVQMFDPGIQNCWSSQQQQPLPPRPVSPSWTLRTALSWI